ncbi:hypothetical protein VEx25_A0599 [Vibrio antiquarius]|uniref:Uncharacterized protein n=2 Tax=Vibrio antiquarius (strain Ex25) TaxID=150340 RepID=A0ACA6QRZ4_VIBAE|nr:hypothetical protein VEA_000255 [Vibrio antiquarius]EDN57129.1 hypothetical protein VEx25_A0599 [Vibrio antiquarius]
MYSQENWHHLAFEIDMAFGTPALREISSGMFWDRNEQ